MPEKVKPLRAQLRHSIPGRTRFRLEAPVAKPERLEKLADSLSALEGVEAVDINPDTGSVLLRHASDVDPLAAAVERNLIEMLPVPLVEPFDATRAISERIEKADQVIGRMSGGRLDAMELTVVGLVAGGLVQLARGKVAGPALTLFGQAVTLALARPLRKFVR